MKRVNVVYAFIYDEEPKKVLMINNVGTGWSLPGGAVENDETLEQAVIREVKEETSLIIEAKEIVAVNEALFEEKGHHALFITFKANVIEGEIRITDKEEIMEIEWVEIQRANELMPYYPNGVDSLLKASAPYLFQG